MNEQSTGKAADFKRRIAGFAHRTLLWGKNHVPAGMRSAIGICFVMGGIFGFLPVLGFWMLPLGLAFIALDVPPLEKRIEAFLDRLEHQANGTAPNRKGR